MHIKTAELLFWNLQWFINDFRRSLILFLINILKHELCEKKNCKFLVFFTVVARIWWNVQKNRKQISPLFFVLLNYVYDIFLINIYNIVRSTTLFLANTPKEHFSHKAEIINKSKPKRTTSPHLAAAFLS